MTLGEKIHLLRRRLGLTQRELGQAAGINVNTIARLERGEILDPSSQAVLRLARALQTSTDFLLGRNEDEQGPLWPPGEAHAWQHTSPAGQVHPEMAPIS